MCITQPAIELAVRTRLQTVKMAGPGRNTTACETVKASKEYSTEDFYLLGLGSS